jgi:AmmeMemoRadiSam system protein B
MASHNGLCIRVLTCLFLPVLFVVLIFGCHGKRGLAETSSDKKKQNEETSQTADVKSGNQTRCNEMEGSIRAPAVAGQFYPAHPGELESMIKGFLAKAREDTILPHPNTRILEILVPHAGYIYSGLTAAYSFAVLEGREYDTVVLLGSPHRVPVAGAVVYCGKAFDCPLGLVPVNVDLAKKLVSSSDLIEDDEEPHLYEHSLEVELPFLQTVLGDFSIVPILIMGERLILDDVAESIVRTVSEAGESVDRILFVISTDLSHYPQKKDAVKSDTEILQAFCSLDGDVLLKKNKEIMARGVRNLACAMCGLDAAYVGIKIANALGGGKATLLHRSVSSDAGIPGADDSQVVGYGAVMVTTNP